MKQKYRLLTLTLLTGTALALPLAAQAQSGQTAPNAAAAHQKKHSAKNPAHKHKTKKGVPLKKAKAIEAQTPVQTPTERLTDAELETAQQVYTGTFPCELGTHVTVTADAQHQGFFTVTAGHLSYYMHPVESSTGAVRMEDSRHSAVWLQLGSKSMLMDQKAGQRVADDCQAVAQQEFAANKKDHPQGQLLNRPAASPQPPVSAASVSAGSSPSQAVGGNPPADAASAP
jgi:hypothetical protein